MQKVLSLRRDAVLFAVLLLAGCATTPLPPTQESFKANTAPYRQLYAMPIQFLGKGNLDKTFTVEMLQSVSQTAGGRVAAAMVTELTAKGYQINSPVAVFTGDEDLQKFDEQTRSTLLAVYEEFDQLSAAIRKNLPKEAKQPFRYKMGPRLGELQKALGAPDASAWVLMSSYAFMESPAAANARRGRSGVGMALALTLGVGFVEYSPSHVGYTLALVDSRTSELLWWNSLSYGQTDVRDAPALVKTVKGFLAKLPPVTAEPPK